MVDALQWYDHGRGPVEMIGRRPIGIERGLLVVFLAFSVLEKKRSEAAFLNT
jgi:hypothetical protein